MVTRATVPLGPPPGYEAGPGFRATTTPCAAAPVDVLVQVDAPKARPPALPARTRPLAATGQLLSPASMPFTWHEEPGPFWASTRYGLRSSFGLVQCSALILPLERHVGPLNRPCGEAFLLHAGRAACVGHADASVAPQLELDAAQLVVGNAGASVLLWSRDTLTAVHLRRPDVLTPWQCDTATQSIDGTQPCVLSRPGQADLVVHGRGARAQLSIACG